MDDIYFIVLCYLQLAEEIAQFDLYKNDPWAVRHTALHRFQQAARRVS